MFSENKASADKTQGNPAMQRKKKRKKKAKRNSITHNQKHNRRNKANKGKHIY